MSAATALAHQSIIRDRRVARMVRFVGLLFFLAFGFWTIDVLQIPTERLLGMFGRIGTMFANRLMPPDMSYVAQPKIVSAIIETIEMSALGAFFGILITMPLAWFAAWNMTPSRFVLYPLARAVIVVMRAVPTLMWAMMLVAMFGFGPLSGTLALITATIGFAGKLMAEQVEAIDMRRVEAIRATGANELDVFFFAVLPQVWPSWVGISIYNWDARFRSSTILGFVGAGGMGLYLREQVSLMEYQSAAGIIMIIIALVIASEALSHFLRHRLY